MYLFRSFFITSCLTVGLVTGCNIDVHEHGHGWSHDDDEGPELCRDYCFELTACGTLDVDAFGECVDRCDEAYAAAPETTERGCECVIDADCQPDELDECVGAPIDQDDLDDDGHFLPGMGGASGGGSEAGSGGSQAGSGGVDGGSLASGGTPGAGASTGGPGSCSLNHDCALGEDCVEGACLPRCVASCQCALGEACEEGYCQPPETPASSCETSCDCTAGEQCLGGSCL